MTYAAVDPAIPQLDVLRDTTFMRSAFAAAMPHICVLQCAVMNLRVKPGKSCLVSYRLTVAKGANAATSQIVAVRFYPAGGSLSRFVKARRAARAIPASGAPVFHMPDLQAVVWAFPNDRKLPGIPALTDEQRILRDVAPRLAPGFGSLSVELIRYIAEHGCTVKLVVHAPSGRGRVFYGKAYSDEKGDRTWRNMNALWKSESRQRGGLRMARPMLYEPEHLTLWQSEVSGPTLASLETSGPEFVRLLPAAGRAVAALHCTSVPGLERLTEFDLHAGLREAERCLMNVRSLAPRVSRIVAALLDAQDGDARPSATLHGDLHAKNIVFTGGAAGLIDLDNLRSGDPIQDLGSFVASTCARSLAHEIAASEIAPMVAALVRAYEGAVPWEVPRSALRWHTAASLIADQAHRTVIRMKVASLDALLGLAEDALGGAGIMRTLL